MNTETITFIVGFLGILLMFWQLNQQINSRFDSLKTDIDSKFDKFDSKFDTVNARIDRLSDNINDLYKAYSMNKRDAA